MENDLMFFRIIVVGDSGNTSINKDERDYIENEIREVLESRSINNFQIKIFN